VVVAFIQGALGGLGFLILGLPQPAFWGTVTVPAAVIPLVGSVIIWEPAAADLLLTGHVGAGVGLIL
jgi:predicted PurR-regulated permease PerM